MPNLQSRFRRVAYGTTALTLALLAAAPAGAEEVTLRSLDGQFVLSGEIVEMAEDAYVLRGALGDLRVAMGRVSCEGEACPKPEADQAAVTEAAAEPEAVASAADPAPAVLAGPAVAMDVPAEGLANDLVAGFAASLGTSSGVETVPGVGLKVVGDAGSLILASDANAVLAKAAPLALVVGPLPASDGLAALRSDVVAFDALAVLAHPSNPVKALSLEQLREVYAGRITNWSALGGPDRPIHVLTLEEGTPRRDALEAALFGPMPVARAKATSPATDPAALVASDPLAIAFVPQAKRGGARTMEVVDSCGITSAPDVMAVKTGTYPLSVPVMVVSRPDETDPLAIRFLDHARSADGVYSAMGLVDRSIITAALKEEDYGLSVQPKTRREARLADEKRADVARHDRLSTTFHFPFAATELNAAGKAELARLADHLAGLPEGSRIMVVGFSDDVGRSKRNHNVSAERARQVAAALQELGGDRLKGVTVTSKGFSDIAPVACNETETGRSLNRRVEIWIERPAQP